MFKPIRDVDGLVDEYPSQEDGTAKSKRLKNRKKKQKKIEKKVL
jgi:hypothetical protein